MKRVPFLFVLGLLCVSLLPSMSQAQANSRRRLIRLDAELFYATASLVFPLSDAWFAGGEIGLGVSVLETMAPGDTDFTSMIHVGGLLTRGLGPRSALDLGVRLGLGDTLYCSASDCWPEGYGALVAGLAFGWTRFRVGTRIILGTQAGQRILAWSPLFLRFRL